MTAMNSVPLSIMGIFFGEPLRNLVSFKGSMYYVKILAEELRPLFQLYMSVKQETIQRRIKFIGSCGTKMWFPFSS